MKFNRIALAVALASLSIGAHATNGYFSHGYGMKAKGMAGVATTSTDDAFFGANNPAAAAFAGNRMELGADLFSPVREFSNTTAGFTVESDSELFLVPEFGYNRMINNDLALGITVYGNGGMNTDYPATFGPFNYFGGTGSLGVDLSQLIIAPTVAYKFAPNHSIGISPLLAYQRFAATGLQFMAGFSASPNNVSEKGHDDSYGYGVRVGYLGKVTPTVTIGAAYASKLEMTEFDSYKGLFAEKGDFDIPENYNLGVSWQATPALRLAFDYQRINYSDVNSVGNAVTNLFSAPLGAGNGPGFGWDDVDVWKLGVEYQYNKAWTFRAGYSHANNPINGGSFTNNEFGEVTMNILAPAVIEDHVTLGFTYTRDNGDQITMAYMHGFENDVSGPSLFNAFDPAGNENIKMYQNSLGIQYSWKM